MYSWYLNNTMISPYSVGRNFDDKGEDLFIHKVRSNDSGLITCVASNGVGEPTKASISLIVQC